MIVIALFTVLFYICKGPFYRQAQETTIILVYLDIILQRHSDTLFSTTVLLTLVPLVLLIHNV